MDPAVQQLFTERENYERLQTAHRQLQATIDRLGNENAKLRAAIDMALNAKQHEDVKAILRGQLSLNEQLAPEDGNPEKGYGGKIPA